MRFGFGGHLEKAKSVTADPASDAFVFFGATGDLAFKQIFPALAGLIRDEGFDVPIIGVARSGDLDAASRHRARASLAGHGRRRRRRSWPAAGPAPLRQGLRRRPGHVPGPPRASWATPPTRSTTWPSRRRSSRGHRQPRDVGLRDRGARIIVEKPFGRDLASAARAEHDRPPGLRRARRSSGSTTTWARSRSRTCSTSGSPTRSSSRSGTATTSSSVQITMAEAFDVADRGAFYDQAGAIRDVVQNHLLQVLSLLAMEPPSGRTSRSDPQPEVQGPRLAPPAPARGRRPRPVPRLPLGGWRGPRLDDRDVRGPSPPPRHVALGRRAVLHPDRQGLPVTATEVLVELQPAASDRLPRGRAAGRQLLPLPADARHVDLARRPGQEARRGDGSARWSSCSPATRAAASGRPTSA